MCVLCEFLLGKCAFVLVLGGGVVVVYLANKNT